MNNNNTLFSLGSYTGTPDNSSTVYSNNYHTSLSSFVSVMGTTPQYFDTYIDYTKSISDWPSNSGWSSTSSGQDLASKNMIPVIGLPLSSVNSADPSADQQFQAFASGQHDDVIRSIVDSWAHNGFSNIVFRPGWEMNLQGPTYAGDSAQSQSDWVHAFQHVTAVLRDEAAKDGVSVQIVWNPGATNYTNANAIANLYPGNSSVDIIGADMYSDMYPYKDYSNSSTYHNWHTGGDSTQADFVADPINREHYWSYPAAEKWGLDLSGNHSTSFESILQFAQQQGKPFAVPETGAGSSANNLDVTDDAAFVHWLATELYTAKINGEPTSFVNIWDSNGGGNYDFSMPADNKPLEAAAWAHYFGANSANIPVIQLTDIHAISALMLPPTTGVSQLFTSESHFDQSVTQSIGTNGVDTISTPLWNDVKSINIVDSTGGSYATNAFLEVKAQLAGAQAGSFLITSAKDGVINLDNGNYTLTVNAHSNGADPVVNGITQHLNDFVITAGSGNDTIVINGFKNYTHGVFTTGSGHDVIVGAQGGNTFNFGSGRAEVTGGAGTDNYVYHNLSGVDIVQNFDSAHDTITLDSALKGLMKVSHGAEGTTLMFGSTQHELVLHAVQNFDSSHINWV